MTSGAVGPAKKTPFRIAIVEDHDDTRDWMRTYLQEEFFVSAHGSAQDLLNFLSANACDLIVSDISLPEMDGFALVAAIRSNPALRDLPVIAASAHITEIGREKARRAGFDAFLAKPVDPDQLLLTIKRYLPHNRSA